MEYGETWLEEGVFGVVEWAKLVDKDEPTQVRHSELVVPIEKEVVLNSDGSVLQKRLCLADTRAFSAPACVVPDIGGPPNRYFYLEARNKWAGFFTEWLDNQEDDNSLSTVPSDASEEEAKDSD